MKNLLLALFSFSFVCVNAQNFEQNFNNYLIQEQEKIIRDANQQIVLEQNFRLLDNLLKKKVLRSELDVAKLHALDNVCDEIKVEVDTAKSTDSLTHFIIFLSLKGGGEWVYSLLKDRRGSGLANPSSNTTLMPGPFVSHNEIDFLPKRTNNIETDNTVYLSRIKELITTHQDKLAPDGITIESYLAYEKQKKLQSSAEYLSLRTSFIRYIYSRYQIPLR